MAHFTAGVELIDMDIAQDITAFNKGRGIHCSLIPRLSTLLFPLNLRLIELELFD